MTSPIQTLGIVGGNMLASMMCLEAQKRGIKTILLEPEINNIASEFANQHMTSTIQAQSIERLALRTDAVVFCTGTIPVIDAKFLNEQNIYPKGDGIDLVANRIEQLVAAELYEVPAPRFYHHRNKDTFFEHLEAFKIPFKLYQIYQDGYEMVEIKEKEDLELILETLDDEAVEWLVEEVNTYERILSMTCIAAPNKIFIYPIQEEFLQDETVKYIEIPALLSKAQEQRIGRLVKKMLKDRECEGLFTFKFGIKKNRALELIGINPGISVGDIATNHFADLSVYEQYMNLIEQKLLKDGQSLAPCKVTVTKQGDKVHVPAFPYHHYLMDKNNALPISIYVKQENSTAP